MGGREETLSGAAQIKARELSLFAQSTWRA